MARKPSRSQLNQVRAWVQQGRTEAWIAHQLEVSAADLRDFIRRNNLSTDEESVDDVDLRDEIEAEIEAALEAEDEEPEEADADEPGEADADEEEREERDPQSGEGRQGAGGRRRRRRRRGPKRAGAGLEATFDHGETDGYGLWLDPAVATDPVYTEHWKDHRKIEVTVEPDQIIIRRAD
jgi:hypothetical protein